MPANSTSVNQVSAQSDDKPVADSKCNQVGSFIKTFNTNQYKQLMSMLSAHLVSSVQVTDSPESASTSCMKGICLFVPVKLADFDHLNDWIMDSGASKHICCNAKLFISMKQIWNSMVTLPNNHKISVGLCGNIQISPNLILKDVFFCATISI